MRHIVKKLRRIYKKVYINRLLVCKKILMLLFNVIFWLTGAIILAVGNWTKISMYKYLELSSFYQPDMPFLLIGVGIVIVLVGTMGCCCTVKGNTLYIYMFAGFLFIIFLVEFITGIVLIINREQFHCCGTDSYQDWFNTPFSKRQSAQAVPSSCCFVEDNVCHNNSTNFSLQDIYIQVMT